MIVVLFISFLSARSIELHPPDSGNLALDNRIDEGGTASLSLKIYTCLNGTVIPQTKVCDFIVDCADGGDEHFCGNCTFEEIINPLCGWKDSSNGSLTWQLGNGTMNESNLPSVDHTTYRPTGHYIYLTANSDSDARFISPLYQQASSTCLFEFWYLQTGISGGHLDVTLLSEGTVFGVLQRFPFETMTNWTKYTLEIGRVDFPFQLAFDATKSTSFSWPAVDDIKLFQCQLPPIIDSNKCSSSMNLFQCARRSCISKARICDMTDDCGDRTDESNSLCSNYQTCSFEMSFCNWTHDPTAQFSWELYRGPTPSDFTGPYRDHTFGNATGRYAYIEGSNPQKPGDRARLISRTFAPNTPLCRLIFYYHMFGEGIGELNIYVRFNANGPRNKIFGIIGERGNRWIRHEQNLNYTVPFQLLIEGVVGPNLLSDIGIDDTIFTPDCNAYSSATLPSSLSTTTARPTVTDALCPLADDFRCATSNMCIGKAKRCNFIVDCLDESDEYECGPCHFEQDQCGWEDVSLGIYSWSRVRANASLAISSPAPGFDHTTNSVLGWYMHVADNMGNFFDPVKMRSPSLPESSSECEIKFSYWFVGDNNNTLSLFSSNKNTLLWTQFPSKSRRWIQVTVPVGANPIGWTLQFELEPNFNHIRDYADTVAIDDIQFSKCSQNGTQYVHTPLSCDFENGTCLWSHDLGLTHKWQRRQGQADNSQYSDHTLETADGWFIDTSDLSGNQTVRLISTLTGISASGICLRFWYRAFGAKVPIFNVYEQESNQLNETLIFVIEDKADIDWREVFIYRQISGHYKFILEAKSDLNIASTDNLAIDDIKTSEGLCPSTRFCDFESSDQCGFAHDLSAKFSWTRYKGSTPSASTGPDFDYTTLTKQGHYMYIEASSPQAANDIARLISSVYPASNEYKCLQFSYHQYGISNATLNVYIQETNRTRPRSRIFTSRGNHFSEWHKMEVSFVPIRPYHIVFEGIVGNTFAGDVSIDDVQIINGACVPIGSCDFESSFCAYKNGEKNREMNWVRMRDMVNDQRNVSETYLAFDMTASTVQLNRALLVSPELDTSSQSCFQYYYRRVGLAQGKLTIFRQTFLNDTLRTQLVRHEYTSFGNEWRKGQIQLERSSNATRLLFEASADFDGGNGTLMLDNFSLINGLCPTTSDNCSLICDTATDTQQCLATNQICDFNIDCLNGDDERFCEYSCDFENGTCKWTDSSKSNYQWRRQRAGIATLGDNNGPLVDHTTLTSYGYYMICSENTGSFHERAHLLSTVLQQSLATCTMTFSYYMNGTNVGRLEVLLITGSRTSRLWAKNGDQGNRWNKALVQIGRLSQSFYIRIDAQGSTFADIAIDDIQWSGCTLPIINNQTLACTSTEFQCKRGNCIDLRRLCDYTDDCGDMSDEDHSTCFNASVMSGCDFETNLCEFRNMNDVELKFKRSYAYQLTFDYGPQRDHTINTVTGSYLYVDTFNQPSDRIAQVVSSRFKSMNGCTVRFYYSINGPTNSVGQLSIIFRSENGGQLNYVWSTTKTTTGYQWARQEVLLPLDPLIELLIEVKTLDSGGGGIIAIDDISFSSLCVIVNDTLPVGTTVSPDVIVTTTVTPCPYRCNNGTCLGKDKRCNFIPDCTSGEDELDCAQCNFESSTCGWHDDSKGYFFWTRRNASSVSLMPGDLNTNRTSGFVMTLGAGSAAFAGSSRLVSERIASTTASCRIKFGIYRNRDKDATLALYLEDDQLLTTKLWSDSKQTIVPNWTIKTVSIGRRRTGFRFIFIAEHVGALISSDLSIDDFRFDECAPQTFSHCNAFINPFNCSNSQCINQNNVCDFSDDCDDSTDELVCDQYVDMCSFENLATPMCSWSHDHNADIQWEHAHGDETYVNNNNWRNYGLDRDHTYGTSRGHFLLLDKNTPSKPKATARIISSVFFPITDGSCQFRFWYHMYGDHIGQLNVYTRTFVDGILTLRWSSTGGRNDEWLQARIQLTMSQNFQVVIEGIRNSSYYHGDIGIDDTSFTPGCRKSSQITLPPVSYSTTQSPYCISTHAHCLQETRQCLPKDQFCNFNIECTDQSDELLCPLTCTFEQNTFCLWNHDPTSQLNWFLVTGNTSLTNNGPSTDHTTNSRNGRFIYLQVGDGIASHYARLISPLYRRSSKTCKFTFWYYTFGNRVDVLNIYVRTSGIDTLIWTMNTFQSNGWRQEIAYLPVCASKFQIIVEGIRGVSLLNYIALDDFRFTDCYESPPPVTDLSPPSPSQFICQSKHYISKSSTCDFELDCCDGSDEEDLLCNDHDRCDFEKDFCRWETAIGTQLFFDRYRADTSLFQQRPPYDHTTRTQLGHFLQVSNTATLPRGTLALLSTHLAPTTENDCSIRFWIFLRGLDNVTIIVGYRYDIGSNLIPLNMTSTFPVTCRNSTRCNWQRVEVSLSRILTKPLEFIIGMSTGTDPNAIMAFDDIGFTPSCKKYNPTEPTTSTTTTPSTRLTTTTIQTSTTTTPSTRLTTTTIQTSTTTTPSTRLTTTTIQASTTTTPSTRLTTTTIRISTTSTDPPSTTTRYAGQTTASASTTSSLSITTSYMATLTGASSKDPSSTVSTSMGSSATSTSRKHPPSTTTRYMEPSSTTTPSTSSSLSASFLTFIVFFSVFLLPFH